MHHRRHILLVVIVFCIYLFSSALRAAPVADSNFIVLSDIHFDPFLSCKNVIPCPLIQQLQATPVTQWDNLLQADGKAVSQFGQDTNYALFVSALSAAEYAVKDKDAKFVLILGDMLGHQFRANFRRYLPKANRADYQHFVYKIFDFLTLKLQQAFPNINVYSAVGNNDSYRSDYTSVVRGDFFKDTSGMWARLIVDANNRQAMLSAYPYAGYYAVTLTSLPNVRLIVLNTNFFSTNALGYRIDATAKQELDWLHDELQTAKQNQQKVLIAMHIPPSIDVYAATQLRFFSLLNLWKPAYQERFQQEIAANADRVVGILAGHLHFDALQTMNKVPIMGSPAISPIFGNKPGFKLYMYSPHVGRILRFATYYYPLPIDSVWQIGIDFDSLSQSNCYQCANNQLWRLRSASAILIPSWQPYYWCATGGVAERAEIATKMFCVR